MTFALFLLVAACLVAGFVGISALRERSRWRRFLEAPFPPAWEKILSRNVPVASFLPAELQEKWRRRIKEFLLEKTFEPCGGLKKISDEVALTIAAGASLLVMNRPGRAWAGLHSVLVYPKAFSAPEEEEAGEAFSGDGGEGGGDVAPVVVRGRSREKRDGESWSGGSVVFSWQRIMRDVALHGNGQNVVIHEFAHQLDAAGDGVPAAFLSARDCKAWRDVASRELARLRRGDPQTVIDEYGAESAPEFFATAVEAFFEKSTAMKTAHAELYALLARLFVLDPATWNYA